MYRHNLILWLGVSVTDWFLWLFSWVPFPTAPFYTVVWSDSMTGVIGFYDYFPSDFSWKSPIFGLRLPLFKAISADYIAHAVKNMSNKRKSIISADDAGWCKQTSTSFGTDFAYKTEKPWKCFISINFNE